MQLVFEYSEKIALGDEKLFCNGFGNIFADAAFRYLYLCFGGEIDISAYSFVIKSGCEKHTVLQFYSIVLNYITHYFFVNTVSDF